MFSYAIKNLCLQVVLSTLCTCNVVLNNCPAANSYVHTSGISKVCLWIINQSKNMTEAQAVCRLQNGYLALIPDQPTMDAVEILLDDKGLSSSQFYIGYKVDTVNNYVVKTLSGTVQTWEIFYSKSVSHALWSCVKVYLGSWFVSRCDDQRAFICSNASNLFSTNAMVTTSSIPLYTTEIYSSEVSSAILSSTKFTISSSSSVLSSLEVKCPSSYVVTTTVIVSSCEMSSQSVQLNSSSYCDIYCPSISPSPTLTINMTDELNSKIEQLKKEIEVDKRSLSSNIRKKTSAKDSRPSATQMGVFGVVLLTLTLGSIVVLDLPLLINELKRPISVLIDNLKS